MRIVLLLLGFLARHDDVLCVGAHDVVTAVGCMRWDPKPSAAILDAASSKTIARTDFLDRRLACAFPAGRATCARPACPASRPLRRNGASCERTPAPSGESHIWDSASFAHLGFLPTESHRKRLCCLHSPFPRLATCSRNACWMLGLVISDRCQARDNPGAALEQESRAMNDFGSALLLYFTS